MIKMKISIKGLDKTVRGISSLGKRKVRKIMNAAEDAAFAIQRESRRSMQMTQKGKPVIRYGQKGKSGKARKRTVRPSLPGHPPAIDLGSLIDNVIVDKKRFMSIEMGLRDTKDAIHGLYLEDPDKTREAIFRRPWFEPATKKVIPQMKKKINAIMRRK